MTSLIAQTSLVIDSNVWISALVFGGEPRKIFESIVERGDYLVVSAELISEIKRTLSRKFPDTIADFELLLIELRQFIVTVPLGSITIKVCRDPDDDKILETALLGSASSIITGDKDLLALNEYGAIKMYRPAEWLGYIHS
jgi:putative PIN family toxin of toxin-antitoxin system